MISLNIFQFEILHFVISTYIYIHIYNIYIYIYICVYVYVCNHILKMPSKLYGMRILRCIVLRRVEYTMNILAHSTIIAAIRRCLAIIIASSCSRGLTNANQCGRYYKCYRARSARDAHRTPVASNDGSFEC